MKKPKPHHRKTNTGSRSAQAELAPGGSAKVLLLIGGVTLLLILLLYFVFQG
jgi:hypothetical protein